MAKDEIKLVLYMV